MHLSRSLKEKRALYAQRHDKVILLRDNALLHVAYILNKVFILQKNSENLFEDHLLQTMTIFAQQITASKIQFVLRPSPGETLPRVRSQPAEKSRFSGLTWVSNLTRRAGSKKIRERGSTFH